MDGSPVGPAINARRFQAENTQRGADLGSMVDAVLNRLHEKQILSMRYLGLRLICRQGYVELCHVTEQRPPTG
jgi:hypothetical protein